MSSGHKEYIVLQNSFICSRSLCCVRYCLAGVITDFGAFDCIFYPNLDSMGKVDCRHHWCGKWERLLSEFLLSGFLECRHHLARVLGALEPVYRGRHKNWCWICSFLLFEALRSFVGLVASFSTLWLLVRLAACLTTLNWRTWRRVG